MHKARFFMRKNSLARKSFSVALAAVYLQVNVAWAGMPGVPPLPIGLLSRLLPQTHPADRVILFHDPRDPRDRFAEISAAQRQRMTPLVPPPQPNVVPPVEPPRPAAERVTAPAEA